MRKSAEDEFKRFSYFRKLLIDFFMISAEDDLLKRSCEFKEILQYWMKLSNNQVEYFIKEVLVKDFTKHQEIVTNIKKNAYKLIEENSKYPAQILFSILELAVPTRATEFLLSYVDDITKIEIDLIGRSILHVAAKYSCAISAFKLILQYKNLDINQLDGGEKSALQIAIEANNSKAVELIVACSKGTVNTANLTGDSLVHVAISQGNIFSLTALLKCVNIDLHAVNNMNQTPFHLALAQGNNKIFKMLIQHPKCIIAKLNEHAGTLLHEAIARFNHFAFIALLSKKELNVNALDCGGITPLCKAIHMKNIRFAQALLQHPKINANTQNISQKAYCRMDREVDSIDEELFFIDEELFANEDRGLRGSLEKDEGFTPLHYVCYDDAKDLITLLVENGASFGIDSESFIGPLDLLLHNSCEDTALVKILSLITTLVGNKKCLFYFNNMIVMFERILINAYCMEYYEDLLSLIIANAIPHKINFKYNHDIKIQNIQNVSLFFALHALTRFDIDYAECATAMLKCILQKTKLLEIDAKDICGNPPLYYACKNSDIEFVSLMIENGANPNIHFYNQINCVAETPLHRACYEGNFNVVCKMLSMGIKIDVLNSKNLTPLAQTAISYFSSKNSVRYIDADLHRWNYLVIMQELLFYGANPNLEIEIFDYDHNVAKKFLLLHGACIEGDITLTQFLLNSKQIEVNMQDHSLNTALHIACKNGDIKIIQLLLKSGADTQLINEEKSSACAMILSLHKEAKDKGEEVRACELGKIIKEYLVCISTRTNVHQHRVDI